MRYLSGLAHPIPAELFVHHVGCAKADRAEGGVPFPSALVVSDLFYWTDATSWVGFFLGLSLLV